MDQELTIPEQDTLKVGAPTERQGNLRADPNACTQIVSGGDTLISSLTPFDPEELPEGTVLAGKYRVEQVLGKGGMGVVLAAEHMELRERVALKLMLPEALESAQAVARFLREARAAAKIKGEHVARVLDVGKLESGAPYIVMEYLEGRDLGVVLEDEGAMAVEDAVACVLQVCEAIAEAHAVGIIHRDLKPSNLFLTQRPDGSPSVKVLDFGISKQLPRDSGAEESQTDVGVTRTRQVLGSPLYMSPEQLTSARNVGPTSDIWSIGAILFELVSGAPPFGASTLSALRRQILFEPTPSVRQLRPEVPRRLDAILRRCLEKDPAQRYPDVAALARDLRDFAPARSRHSIERVQAILRNAGASGAVEAVTPGSRRRNVALAIAAAALALGALGSFAASRRDAAPPAPAAAPVPEAVACARAPGRARPARGAGRSGRGGARAPRVLACGGRGVVPACLAREAAFHPDRGRRAHRPPPRRAVEAGAGRGRAAAGAGVLRPLLVQPSAAQVTARPPSPRSARPPLLAALTLGAALLPTTAPAAPPPGTPAPAPAPSSAPASAPAPAAAPAPAPAPAPASPPAPSGVPDASRAAYNAARVLYEDGDYAGALLGFQRSYELSGDLNSLWNMALCEKSLRHYARAVRLLEKYRIEGGERLSEQDRAGAAYLIETMRAFVSTLKLTANERGAAVLIDDEQVGITPLARPLLVDMGFRRVRVLKKGFVAFDERRQVVGGEEVSVEARLVPEVHEGRLEVSAGPQDIIWIDGKPVGQGRFAGAVPSGGHTLRVTAPGMRSYEAEVLVQDDRLRRMQVTLDPLPRTGIPAWVLVAGGAALAAGVGVGAGYLLFGGGGDAEPTRGNLAPYAVDVRR